MFEGVFPLATVKAEEVARLCLRLFQKDTGTNAIRLYDRVVNEKTLYREVSNRQHFDIEVSGGRLSWGGVKNYNLALIIAENLDPASTELMLQLNSLTPLIVGRLYESKYEYWENAEDPLEFESEGRFLDGLPMKSNELPPPLEQMIVDTSGNPGRRILRNGYVEAVGHRMWLGPEFFRRVPASSRGAVLSASWLRTSEIQGGLLEVLAANEPFCDRSTAEVQSRLRQLLFPDT